MTEESSSGNIVLYALSTCMWCKKTKALLDSKGVTYKCIHVNELEGEALEKVKAEVLKHNPRGSYPTLCIGDKVIVGYNPEEIEEALG